MLFLGSGREQGDCALFFSLLSFSLSFFQFVYIVPWSIETEENKQVIRFRDFVSFQLVNLVSHPLFVSWNTWRERSRGVRIKRGRVEAWWNSIKFDARGVVCSTRRDCTRFTIDSIYQYLVVLDNWNLWRGGAREIMKGIGFSTMRVQWFATRSNCANVFKIFIVANSCKKRDFFLFSYHHQITLEEPWLSSCLERMTRCNAKWKACRWISCADRFVASTMFLQYRVHARNTMK